MGNNTTTSMKTAINGQIILRDFHTEKALFENLPGAKADSEVEINPHFYRMTEPEEDDLYKVTLGVTIDEPNKLPFRLEAALSGTFKLNNIPEDRVKDVLSTQVTAILFPYLRSMVSALTSLAAVPPIYLPVINAAALYKQIEER